MLLPVSSRAVPADQGGAELSVGEQQGRDAGPRPGGDIQLKVRLGRCGRISNVSQTEFLIRSNIYLHMICHNINLLLI